MRCMLCYKGCYMLALITAANLVGSSGEATSKGSSLLQLSNQQGVYFQISGEEEHGASWVTGPFGSCEMQCGGGSWRTREVECRSFANGALLQESACAQAGLPRPGWQQDCSCELSPCVQASCGSPGLPEKVSISTGGDVPNVDFECIGCFPFLEDDETEVRDAHELTDGARDLTCMNWTRSSPCRSGLPFYRMRSNLLSPSLCLEFCLGQGLDLFGIVDGVECRCGASHLNHNVWGPAGPRFGLHLPAESESCTTDSACRVRVYRYSGPMISGGVPAAILEPSAQDVAYVDSIVGGRRISQEDEEDGPEVEGDEEQESFLDSMSGPGWERLCNSAHGCLSGQKWPEREAAPFGGLDAWEEYTAIPYVFEAGLDAARKEAFRAAVVRWHEKTCISLVEKSSASGYYVRVGLFNANSCSATRGRSSWQGRPYNRINLGWCNSMFHLGTMVHEIGHAVGIAHEQKRPDGSATYYGKGPHLKVWWQHISKGWTGQYTPDQTAYTGSGFDGPGDVHTGYAPYDFESIMHYGSGGVFETLPYSAMALVGNRKHLSNGDIRKVHDAYECRRKGAVTSTSMRTTPSVSSSSTISTSTLAGTTVTTTRLAPGGSCARNEDCIVNAWCRDTSYISWCQRMGRSCPGPQCMWLAPSTTGTVASTSVSLSTNPSVTTTIVTSTTRRMAKTTTRATSTTSTTTRSVVRSTTTTTAASTGSSAPATTSTTPSQGCVLNGDCAANPWCSVHGYDSWCQHNAASCPSPMCIRQ